MVMNTERLHYYQRILSAYVLRRSSQLTFWHDIPSINSAFKPESLGEYYMDFPLKANYSGPHDPTGVPLINYRGSIGVQYNPIAIAQYGLGNFNLFRRTGDPMRLARSLVAADWLVANLEPNASGFDVWNHHFHWEYRTPLIAPWYSGLAQGQGISLLLRVYMLTGNVRYKDAACRAFKVFGFTTVNGGVLNRTEKDLWIEEYIVDPPTHILNGCIWALWGIYDFALSTGDTAAWKLFSEVCDTVARNLHHYDTGFWSLYEQSNLPMEMFASPFYHALHIVQLRVLYQLTRRNEFLEVARRWERYTHSKTHRTRALIHKTIFKLIYY
jgi:heparosan-N-sulfate-glucuronate 5-epimerase